MTGLQSRMTDVLIQRRDTSDLHTEEGPVRTQPDDSRVQAEMSGRRRNPTSKHLDLRNVSK